MRTEARTAAIAALILTGVFTANAAPIVGLTIGNRIVGFDSATPGLINSDLAVSGLTSGHNLIGIDFRPADGALVGVSRSTSNDNAQVYTINPTTGAASMIGGVFPFAGTFGFGVDFNPVPGALRLISDSEVNLRITAGGGGVVNIDGMLTRNPPNADPSLQISGAAYANNVPGGAGGNTTLYVVDSATGNLYTQGTANFPGGGGGVSPNTGSLFLVGSLGLGANIGTNVGLDVSDVGLSLLSAVGAEGDQLYSFNPTTGAATLIGAIGSANATIDIAIAPVPEPAAFLITAFGLGLLAAGRRLRRRV